MRRSPQPSLAAYGELLMNLTRREVKGRYSQSLFGAAWAIENQGRPADAIERYRRVAEGHDGETAARAQFQIGESLFAQKKYDDAVREFQSRERRYGGVEGADGARPAEGRSA